MRPLRRSSVNRSAGARGFRNDTRYTKAANMNAGWMRGGIRL